MKDRSLVITAEAWNARVPVGAEVWFFPVAGMNEAELTRTRSEAWQPVDFLALVKVEGRAGGVDVAHCLPVPGQSNDGRSDEVGPVESAAAPAKRSPAPRRYRVPVGFEEEARGLLGEGYDARLQLNLLLALVQLGALNQWRRINQVTIRQMARTSHRDTWEQVGFLRSRGVVAKEMRGRRSFYRISWPPTNKEGG